MVNPDHNSCLCLALPDHSRIYRCFQRYCIFQYCRPFLILSYRSHPSSLETLHWLHPVPRASRFRSRYWSSQHPWASPCMGAMENSRMVRIPEQCLCRSIPNDCPLLLVLASRLSRHRSFSSELQFSHACRCHLPFYYILRCLG